MFKEIVKDYDKKLRRITKKKGISLGRLKAMNLRLSNDILERINDVRKLVKNFKFYQL